MTCFLWLCCERSFTKHAMARKHQAFHNVGIDLRSTEEDIKDWWMILSASESGFEKLCTMLWPAVFEIPEILGIWQFLESFFFDLAICKIFCGFRWNFLCKHINQLTDILNYLFLSEIKIQLGKTGEDIIKNKYWNLKTILYMKKPKRY